MRHPHATEHTRLELKKKTLEVIQTLKPEDAEDTEQELQQVQAKLDEHSLRLKNLQNLNRLNSDEMAKAKKEEEAAKKKRKKLEEDIALSLQQAASLRAKLDAAAESYGLACGWIPQPESWQFKGNMGGDIRLGKPVPPTPVAAKPNTPPKKNTNVVD